jgi:hypothetical protein
VRLARDSADRDDRRSGLGERRSLRTGADEDERAGRRVEALAVELEDGSAFQHKVELLLLVVRLVALVEIAGGAGGPRVEAKAAMPKWCRTGRQGQRPSSSSSISSRCATA